jgi:hypothetical protein
LLLLIFLSLRLSVRREKLRTVLPLTVGILRPRGVQVDAEQSYFQPAIDAVTLRAALRFNRSKATLFNTYQAYLVGTQQRLCADLRWAAEQQVALGVKLVRGRAAQPLV